MVMILFDLHTACSCTRTDLKKLSDVELIALADLVGVQTGEVLIQKEEREAAAEKQFYEELLTEYNISLDPALDKAIANLPEFNVQTDHIQLAMRQVDDDLKARNKKPTQKILDEHIIFFTFTGVQMTREQVSRIRKQDPFDVVDETAVAALSEQQLFWIDQYWSDHLSRRISATVADEMLGSGLGREQAGEIMKKVISGEFPGVSVPKTFRGTPDDYFQMLAGTVRNRATNMGSIAEMVEAKITTYRIDAILDNRTSEVCQMLNGQTFTVEQGRQHVERTLAVRDPEEFKSIAGWRTPEEVESLMNANRSDSDAMSMALSSAGLTLPPYHARCRTIINAID